MTTVTTGAAGANALANLRSATRLIPSRVARTVVMDGVAARRRVFLHAKRNELHGLCIEHIGHAKGAAGCCTLEDAVALHDRTVDDKVHIAGEILVLALSTVGRAEARAVPVLAAPSCGRGAGDAPARLLSSLFQSWNTMPASDESPTSFADTHGPILAVGTDAATPFRSLCERMCRTDVPSHALRFGGVNGVPEVVVLLPGADFLRLVGGTAAWFWDWLHVDKRARMPLLGDRGIVVSEVLRVWRGGGRGEWMGRYVWT